MPIFSDLANFSLLEQVCKENGAGAEQAMTRPGTREEFAVLGLEFKAEAELDPAAPGGEYIVPVGRYQLR